MIGALRTHLRRLSDDSESGQALVEFVLVFPVQLLLTLAILQFAYLAHAHLVVSQAAFQGARAGAVADVPAAAGIADGTPAADREAAIAAAIQAAGRRSAARTCALLTNEFATASNRITTSETIGPEGQLRWTRTTGTDPGTGAATTGSVGFNAERQSQAYALLTSDTKRDQDWIVCDIEYDYVMQIPVANHFFAPFSTRPDSTHGTPAQRYPTFNIRRVGFVPVPWRTQGIED